MSILKRAFLVLTMLMPVCQFSYAGNEKKDNKVINFYTVHLRKEIDKPAFKLIKDALNKAKDNNSDYIILDLNTYGGALDAADSIRSSIMQSTIPVIAFINIQAASAGALISIACDSIYMRNGSSIGAATVVDQTGNVLPDKYQSFMRAMMRATAESHGKKTIIKGNDTTQVWFRDPAIAQAMVSKDSVLSFTCSEAISNGYCEGMAETVEDVAKTIANGNEYVNTSHTISALNKLIYLLLSPYLQGLFLMLIIGGIYFELQSPGIGFPLAAAVTGALLYFAPLYLEGLAQNWEIIVFVVGILLLFAEIFIIPGFGVAGISGIILIILSLSFAMIDNDIVFNGGNYNFKPLIKPFAIVLVSMTSSIFLSIYLASKLYPSKAFSYISLKTKLSSDTDGFVGVEKKELNEFVGKTAIVATDLHPQGFIEINGKRFPAQIAFGFASKGDSVIIIKNEGGRLYCKKDK